MKKTVTDYYLINPQDETITVGTISYSNTTERLKAMYDVIGCRLIDRLEFPDEKHDVVIDDEGLYNLGDTPKFFTIDENLPPLAGKGMVFGLEGPENDYGPPTMTLEELKKIVKFHDARSAAYHDARIHARFDEYRNKETHDDE